MDKESILAALVQREKELQDKVKELKESELELKGITDAIKALGGSTIATVSGGDSYDKTSSWPVKIKFAIKQLGEASVQDVIKFIIDKEPEFKKEETKVYNNVTSISSSLYRAGDIKAKKDGNRNIYYI